MDGKAIMMCVVFLAAILLGILLIRRIKKQMDKNGVEVIGIMVPGNRTTVAQKYVNMV